MGCACLEGENQLPSCLRNAGTVSCCFTARGLKVQYSSFPVFAAAAAAVAAAVVVIVLPLLLLLLLLLLPVVLLPVVRPRRDGRGGGGSSGSGRQRWRRLQ